MYTHRRLLQIEQLESRQLLTLYVDVTSDAVDANPGDGDCRSASGACTLRAAVMEANALPGRQEIVIPPGTYTLTLTGSDEDSAATGDLDITGNVSIVGSGADRTSISASALDRVFHVLPGATLEITDLTIANGGGVQTGGGIRNEGTLTMSRTAVDGNSAFVGGGIANATGAMATIQESTISRNAATGESGDGGGIFTDGVLTLLNTTISGNSAIDSGGGIRLNTSADVMILHSTVANNAGVNGAGIWNAAGEASFSNSIVTNRIGGTPSSDLGYNILGVDPGLGPLEDNGGRTATHALTAGSAAIDAGRPLALPGVRGVPRFDQRSDPYTRVYGGRIDIGAVERQPRPLFADFSRDGVVDGEDFLIWQQNFGLSNGGTRDDGDADDDGDVDGEDFLVWQAEFAPGGVAATRNTAADRESTEPPATPTSRRTLIARETAFGQLGRGALHLRRMSDDLTLASNEQHER